jgi:Xaa-Pro aminopeptidase
LFEYTIKANGATGIAFPTIAASGKNATVLHYTKNDGLLSDGHCLLLDLGAKYQYYCADITRTYPVNGVFDERQRLVYQLVLSGQKLVLSNIKPGTTTAELNDILRYYYVGEMTKLGLITAPEQLDDYYYHGVSHSLGLDTHDIGILSKQPLVAGNVITCEPGLYIGQWDIGVRIEDDVLVTENGYEVMSSMIPKELEEIEVDNV